MRVKAKEQPPTTGELVKAMEDELRKDAPALPRVSDLIGTGIDDFYPHATKTTLEAVIALGDVVILDCVIVDNFETQFGSHTLAIVAVAQSLESLETFTFPTSGQVVVDKLRKLKIQKALPVIGAFLKEKRYYDLK